VVKLEAAARKIDWTFCRRAIQMLSWHAHVTDSFERHFSVRCR